MSTIQKSLNVKKIFTDNMDIFMIADVYKSQIYWLAHDLIDSEEYKNCIYKLGGINFMKNMYKKVTVKYNFLEKNEEDIPIPIHNPLFKYLCPENRIIRTS